MIYFAKFGDAVKIGYSENPKQRIADLQVGAHERLECLLVIDGGRNIEKELQSKFAELNTRSTKEWFYYKDPIKEFIEKNLENDRRYEFDLLEDQQIFSSSEQLKRLRKWENLTFDKMGKLLGLTAQSVKETEGREKDGSITLKKLRRYGLSLGYKLEYRFVQNIALTVQNEPQMKNVDQSQGQLNKLAVKSNQETWDCA